MRCFWFFFQTTFRYNMIKLVYYLYCPDILVCKRSNLRRKKRYFFSIGQKGVTVLSRCTTEPKLWLFSTNTKKERNVYFTELTTRHLYIFVVSFTILSLETVFPNFPFDSSGVSAIPLCTALFARPIYALWLIKKRPI